MTTQDDERSARFWSVIRERTIDFNRYKDFVDRKMGSGSSPPAYERLKLATATYRRQQCGADPPEPEHATALPKVLGGCPLDLIWSYWHEEGMLVQSAASVLRRFQNLPAAAAADPLAALDLDPLRPIGDLLWGFIKDEPSRLTVARRAYEYDHHYGLKLHGAAVTKAGEGAARSTFTEAFEQLLRACSLFFRQDDDTTAAADGAPILTALRAVHLLLSEGAHNQFGDLPATARGEMLMEMWMLARPEVGQFLRGPEPTQHPEPWMPAIDRVNSLQRRSQTDVSAFRDLAVSGERLVLSIRDDGWSARNTAPVATSWARQWRPEVQKYIHAYRAATGVSVSG